MSEMLCALEWSKCIDPDRDWSQLRKAVDNAPPEFQHAMMTWDEFVKAAQELVK